MTDAGRRRSRTAAAPRTGFLAALLLAASAARVAGQGQVYRAQLPDSLVYRKLDSLVHVALTSPDHDQRVGATIGLLSFGNSWYRFRPERSATPPPAIPYHGVVRRVVTIFDGSDDPLLRRFIVRWINSQSEREEVVAFLLRLAEGPPGPASSEHATMPEEAVYSLAVMGPEGLAALRRLKAAGTVRDLGARGYLDDLDHQIELLKEHGYRYGPPEKQGHMRGARS